MAIEGRKGEWVVVIGCGTNRLEGARLVSNVTRIWGERNSLCQLPRSGGWRDSHPFLPNLCQFEITNNTSLPICHEGCCANRYAVVGDIAIHFYLILFKKASPFIPNSRNLA